jgi:hypothetical protein
MKGKLPDESFTDVSSRVKATLNKALTHKINSGEKHGLAKRSDFDPQGVETPARVSRARVNPADAAKERRAGLIDVNEIRSPSGSPSHVPEPSPRKL